MRLFGLWRDKKNEPQPEPVREEQPRQPEPAPAPKVRVIGAASYPKMAPYPSMDSEDFGQALEEWEQGLRAQRRPDSYARGMQLCYAVLLRSFLDPGGQENRVFSPMNLYLALAMLAECTGENSRRQLLRLLGTQDLTTLRSHADDLWNAHYRDDGHSASLLANALWLRQGLHYERPALEALAEHHHASSFQAVMGSEQTDKALRQWLNDQTHGLLKEQTASVQLDAATVLALTSAVYYRAAWASPFEREDTSEGVFHSANGDVTCQFMHGRRESTYYWGGGCTAVRWAMEDDREDMWFILPDESTPEQLLHNNEVLAFLLCGGDCPNQRRTLVNLSLPKFDISSEVDLKDILQKLGVTDVFDETLADFTPIISEPKEVCLSQARHDARIVVDEDGVEAAATTLLAVTMKAARPVRERIDFVLDRPFIFAVTGSDGLPLFAGVVNQPK